MYNEITLEQLKNMSYGSFDKIVDLYSQGYRLSNAIDIKNLAAQGEIISAVASKDATKTYITVAFYHVEPSEYIHINAAGTGITAGNDYKACRGGFSALSRITSTITTTGAATGDVTLTSKLCASGGSCTAVTCTTETTAISTRVIPLTSIITHVTTAPGNVGSLTATPGDGTLNITWSAPTSGAIYGYHIDIIPSGGRTVMNGFQTGTTFNATGLTNGTVYTINVYPISTSSINGGTSTITATPTSGTVTQRWKCTNPSGASGSKCTSGTDATYTYVDQATCEAATDCKPATSTTSTTTKKKDYTPWILVGAALAAAYIILTPTDKKATPAQTPTQTTPSTIKPTGAKPLPTQKDEVKPETPTLPSPEKLSSTKQKEEDALKELEALSKQKEETKRLREIEDKRDRVKREIAEMYAK